MSTEQSTAESPDLCSVRVAVRIRPQSARERIEFCRICATVTPGEPQILLGNDRAFTFDYVFNSDSSQDQIFESCAKPLIQSCLEGYNSTIFAYGQTGSGKTYTMGTGFEVDQRPSDIGIIPRAVELLFTLIRERRAAALANGIPVPEFQVSAQFLELYNEEVYDLFAADREVYNKRAKSVIKIHESSKGEIYCENVTLRQVNSLADTMECLRMGSLGRATASTAMNAQSSRSHAIFTLFIRQQRAILNNNNNQTPSSIATSTVSSSENGGESATGSANLSPSSGTSETMVVSSNGGLDCPEFEILSAKFHFVDLAGSERLKRTGATGERAREGISINCGLLALGNVISALGDTSRHCSHVPYRDSKLTRILQDSLGGNSCTVMVACISPSDCDFVETLNTLKYSNRARNIRNKVTVNQDKTSAVISALRAEIIQLKQELLEFKQGKRFVDADGSERQNDVDKENALLLKDNDLLRRRIHALQETIEQLTETNARMLASVDLEKMNKLVATTAGVNGNGSHESPVPLEGQENNNNDNTNNDNNSINKDETTSPPETTPEALVLRYARQMEQLRAQLAESQGLCRQLLQQRNGSAVPRSAHNTPRPLAASVNGPLLSNSFASPAMQPPFATSSALGTPLSGQKMQPQQHQQTLLNNGDNLTLSLDMFDINNAQPDNDDALLDEARSKLARLQQQLIMQGSGGSDVVNGNGLDNSLGCNGGESNDECETGPPQNQAEMQELDCEITEIQKQINIQQQLIERLEQSQRQMQAMRQQYEAKVGILQAKIRETEAERDRVLNNVERTETATKDKSEQLRVDYEAKINALQLELKKVQTAAREYTRNQVKQQENDRKLEQMRAELQSMKQAKTALVRRLRDESLKQRKAEAEKNREIAHLRRQHQQKDSVIQRLEAEKRMRETVMRRQQEEAEAVRRRQVNPAMKRAVTANNQTNRTITANNQTVCIATETVFSSDECEEVWQVFLQRLNHFIAGRSLLNRADCELKRLLGERETLNQRLQRYLRQRGHVTSSPMSRVNDLDVIADLETQIDALKANIRYNEDSIEECQRRIIQLVSPSPQQGETNGGGEEQQPAFDGHVDLKRILTGCGLRLSNLTRSPEALRFVVDKLMNAFIAQGVSLSRLESSATTATASSSNEQAGDLVPTNDLKTPTKTAAAFSAISEDLQQTPKATPVDSQNGGFLAVSTRSAKARRWSATTQELLFGRTPNRDSSSLVNGIGNGLSTTIAAVTTNGGDNNNNNVVALGTLVEQDSEQDNSRSLIDSSSDALVETLSEADHANIRRASLGRQQQQPQSVSSEPGVTSSYPVQQPSSPQAVQRIAGALSASQLSEQPPAESNNNVFHRLTRGSRRGESVATPDSEAPVAIVSQMPGKIRASNSFILNNSFSSSFNSSANNPSRGSSSSSPSPCFTSFDTGAPVVEYVAQASGHTRTVLCVTGDSRGLLFTGSKDRTAKAWDLMENREIFALTGHPDSVVRVLYSQQNRLLFTVAGACVRVWDCRCFSSGPVAEIGSGDLSSQGCVCCQTLLSSGLSMEGAGSRNQLLQTGRTDTINDAALLATPATELLMSTLNADIRVWDLRNFNSMAKLVSPGSGISAVMSLCTAPQPYRYVFTGSRDHLVRFYDLPSQVSGSFSPRLTFEPPHCDSVNALAFNASCSQSGGRMVTFSGSRDGCLKKWEWDSESAKTTADVQVHVLSNAHRAGITSMAVIPWLVDSDYQDQLLVSTGRDGALRIWNASPDVPLTPLAEVTSAHAQPINAVAGATTDNGCFVYTASNDRHVRIWRLATKD